MEFKEATDRLFDRIDHADLAGSLNISVASIRQARLSRGAKAYREPPKGWESAVIRLAEKRASSLNRLVEQLRGRAAADNPRNRTS